MDKEGLQRRCQGWSLAFEGTRVQVEELDDLSGCELGYVAVVSVGNILGTADGTRRRCGRRLFRCICKCEV